MNHYGTNLEHVTMIKQQFPYIKVIVRDHFAVHETVEQSKSHHEIRR